MATGGGEGKLLENKVAWVTGGASGYGKQYALRLAKEGCKIALCDANEAKGEKVAQEIQEKYGKKVLFKKVDVRMKKEVDLFAEEVFEQFNGLDIAVNNAGIWRSSPFLKLEESEWDQVLDTNLKGCFLCSQAAAKVMVEHKIPGKIVNIGSDSGVIGRSDSAHYSTSKAGVIMLTKVIAFEVAKYGIHVNCLCPGPAYTEGVMANLTSEDARKKFKERVDKTPLKGRALSFEEIANCLIFLVSPESNYVTGQVLVVDGAYTAALEV